MAVPFHYSKEYYKARRLALIFGIAGLVLSGPLALSFLFIAFYNSTCASVPSKEFSCDGSTCDCGCSALTPSTSPELFTFLFIWLAAVIVLVILAIINIAKAKAVKVPIPYTPAELAQMEWQRIEREQRRQASMIIYLLTIPSENVKLYLVSWQVSVVLLSFLVFSKYVIIY